MPWAVGPWARTKRLETLLVDRWLDGCVVSGRKEVYYFTGFLTARLILPTYLLLRVGREPVLLTGSTDEKKAAQTFGGQIVVYENYRLEERMVAYPDYVAAEAEKLVREYLAGSRRIGIDAWNLPHSLYQAIMRGAGGVELADISHDILSMRSVKDEDEIELIRRSCELADKAYIKAKTLVTPGRTEVEIYSEIHRELSRLVGTFQYFAGDFVSGERTVEVGGPPTTRVIKEGEPFIFDLWITTQEYWSDTCRTFAVGGRPREEIRRLHSLVLRALERGVETLKLGVTGAQVYGAIRGVFKEAGYGEHFPHHAGHGIGLDGQEPPFFIPGSKEALRPGMVVTLEPGLYVPGVGGVRIENNFLVTEDGPKLLTFASTDL
ncbi:MAG: Xaa-Pro peptidase family protein [Nitrososphaerota archaeon]|nr:Xaa-Pro peptidase family protein [Candidatus Calditenuaceae archaeon]MDW8074081.1 Xaa-Pro peptidase family protein [Nitrososphaerota archaeon]